MSENVDGDLINTSTTIKENLKVWLSQYKMINDTIDILDAKVVNVGVKFSAVVNYDQDKFEALNAGIIEIQDMFKEKLDIGQPIYITKIYDILNNLDEIVDVTHVKIENVSGNTGAANYSEETLDMKKYMSADGRILYAPENAIYELKYPNLDIKGTIK